jgi:hypothetical protein
MPAEGATIGVDCAPKRIFLSYARADRERANAVKMLLELGGAQVFMDWRSIPPGIEWEVALTRALADCDVLCVFWSAAAQRSKWVRSEYTTFTRAFPDRLCVPLHADATVLPPTLATRQAPPEFLALANELLALRRDLVERGISRRETRRIVQARLAQAGLQLDEAQLKKLLSLFASGLSLGVLLTSLPKSLRVVTLLAAIAAVVALIWHPWSRDRASVEHSDGTTTPGAASMLDGDKATLRTDGGTSGSQSPEGATQRPPALELPPHGPAHLDAPARAPEPLSAQRVPPDRWDSSGWVKLGERAASGVQRDRIEIGPCDGRVTELKIDVENCNLDVLDLEITFGNSERLQWSGRHMSNDGSHTLKILPGDERVITSLDFEYKNLPCKDRARVAVWGRNEDPMTVPIRQLSDRSYKIRFAAAFSLWKSRDPRAVFAIANALTYDDDSSVRRIAAIVLSKMIDATTGVDARELGLDALAAAATNDPDQKVRAIAARGYQDLVGLRRKSDELEPAKPKVFVNVDRTTDLSKMVPSNAGKQIARIVRKSVECIGYATSWPGGPPTQSDLTRNHARAFIIASTVKKIELTKLSDRVQVSCDLEIRVAPWSGTDGGERWDANKAASTSGSSKAMTGNSNGEIAGGVRDCLDAVAEDVTRQIMAFLKRVAANSQ